MKFNVHISPICGLCYGSNNAITSTREALKTNKNVVLYKEILHNKNVLNELENSGAKQKNDLHDLEKNDYVIIRGHGEPLSTFEYLEKNSIKYLDCTCPNVLAINKLVIAPKEVPTKILLLKLQPFSDSSLLIIFDVTSFKFSESILGNPGQYPFSILLINSHWK